MDWKKAEKKGFSGRVSFLECLKKKKRDITLPTKVHLFKAMAFLVVMYGCERLTIKAENQRFNAFELWC